MTAWKTWLVLVALASTISPPAARSATPSPRSAFDAQYAAFLRARNERLGRWLPQGEDLFEPWRRRMAAPAAVGWNELFTLPKDATSFWYRPTARRVLAVYDPRPRVVLYRQGCCAWEETVLGYAPEPPQHVRTARLAAVRSRKGVPLGASPAAVVRAYGAASLHPSTTTPGLRVLSYYEDQHLRGSSCGWFENFVFRANRLIEIQAGHGC
jgi:hypothetical protein